MYVTVANRLETDIIHVHASMNVHICILPHAPTLYTRIQHCPMPLYAAVIDWAERIALTRREEEKESNPPIHLYYNVHVNV